MWTTHSAVPSDTETLSQSNFDVFNVAIFSHVIIKKHLYIFILDLTTTYFYILFYFWHSFLDFFCL